MVANAANREQIAAKIEALLAPVEQICRGQKPTEYPPELLFLMEQMWDQGLLIETPASYLYLPGEEESDELTKLKGQTWVHPISQELTLRKLNIDNAASPDKIYNYKVLGLDPYYRQLDRSGGYFDKSDPLEQAEDVGALILTRSDMHGLRQALHILYAKLTSDARTHDVALIIQNTHNGFWDPLFECLDLKQNNPGLADLNIHVTQYPGGGETADEGRTSTLHVLKSLGPKMALAPAADRMDARIKPGDTVYVASGSAHKPIEISDAFAAMLARVNVLSLNSRLMIKPEEAEETSCSLEGNDIEKMLSAKQRILDDIGYENACAQLCPGGRPENTWIIFDDRGLEFKDPRILQTRAFDPVRELLNPYTHKLGPGAELALILKTISRTRMFEEMLAGAVKEIEEATNGDPAQKADTTVVDTACHILVRLDWLKDPHNQHYIASFAKVRSHALTQPQPLNDNRGKPIKALQTDHYLAPLRYNLNAERGEPWQTKAQIDNYIATSSEVAGSLRAIGALTGIDEHSQNLSQYNLTFRSSAQGSKFKLATLYSMFPEIYGTGSSHLPSTLKSAMNGSFKVINADNRRYGLSEYKKARPIEQPARMDETHKSEVKDTLAKLRTLYEDADAFVLTEDDARVQRFSGLKWLKTLFYFSLMVGKQVDDRAIKPKYFGILESALPDWKDQEAIFDHLAQTPLLINKYDDLIDQHSARKTLKKALGDFKTSYVRPEILEKGTITKTDFKPMPPDLYRVTIYCSASLGKNTAACREARDFSFDLACGGFAVINGGGKEGLMHATSDGVHMFRRWWRKNRQRQPVPRNYVISYQCHDTFEREGGWHKENDGAIIFETIEERMANLQNTDAEILMAGGAGSVQEIAASLLMRQWGLAPVMYRPLVIVNQSIDGVPAFNPVANMLDADERRALNIHIVDTADEALEIVMHERAKMHEVLGSKVVYVPAQSPLTQPAHVMTQKPVADARVARVA